MAQPHIKAKIMPGLLAGQKKSAANKVGITRPESSARMKANNPMRNPESVEKMRRSLSGRTFLARGGNGKMTPQQLAVSKELGLPMEYVILTAPVSGQFTSLPRHYKVDLAHPESMTAIEIDGKTHKTKRWKFLDRRKTEVLNALGWSVLRFWNEEVTGSFQMVLEQIRASIALK